jgi:hypothetical protein
MKKITFIIQSKGGVGKSAFTYMIANKYEKQSDIVFVDMDNETNTSASQLQFTKKTIAHNLIDTNTKNIDRAAFDSFFEDFIQSKKLKSAICDLGATTSEQFLVFLKEDSGHDILNAIHEMGVEIQLCCIVAGLNAFHASSTFCKELFKAIGPNSHVKRYIVKNNFFEFSPEQSEAIAKLAEFTESKIEEFNIVPNNVPGTLKELHSLMGKGESLDSAKVFTKLRIKPSIDAITVEI